MAAMQRFLDLNSLVQKGEPDPEGLDREKCFACKFWHSKEDLERCDGLIYAAFCHPSWRISSKTLVYIDEGNKRGWYCEKCRERLQAGERAGDPRRDLTW